MEDLAGRSITIAIVALKHVGRFIIGSAAAANASSAGYMFRKLFYAFQIVVVSLALSSHEGR